MNTKSKTYRLVIRAILTAIIILQTMVPFLGFIPIGITSLTIIHITVIVAAIVLGTKRRDVHWLSLGYFYHDPRLYLSNNALRHCGFHQSNHLGDSPCVGWLSGWSLIYDHLQEDQKVVAASIVAAIFGTITNTVLVLTLMGTLYTSLVANTYGVDASALFVTLGGIAVTNGISEVITAAVLTPILVKALFAATSLRPENR